MGYQQHNYEDEWGEPEPEKNETNWALWAGIGAGVLFLIGLCLVGGYFLVQQFQQRTTPPPTLVVPTSAVPTAIVEPTDPPLAPTATLQEPATAVPLTPDATNPATPPAVVIGDAPQSELPEAAAVDAAPENSAGRPFLVGAGILIGILLIGTAVFISRKRN